MYIASPPATHATITTAEGIRVSGARADSAGALPPRLDGRGHVDLEIGQLPLAPGAYEVEIGPPPPIVVGKTDDRFSVPARYRSRKTSGP